MEQWPEDRKCVHLCHGVIISSFFQHGEGFPNNLVGINGEIITHLLRFVLATSHGILSRRQFVQGGPISATLHRTLRDLQTTQATKALVLDKVSLRGIFVRGKCIKSSSLRVMSKGQIVSEIVDIADKRHLYR